MLTLSEGRLKAQEWLRMIARGIDPAAEMKRQKQVKIEKRKNSFGAVSRIGFGTSCRANVRARWSSKMCVESFCRR
jgi:hypothetical protein